MCLTRGIFMSAIFFTPSVCFSHVSTHALDKTYSTVGLGYSSMVPHYRRKPKSKTLRAKSPIPRRELKQRTHQVIQRERRGKSQRGKRSTNRRCGAAENSLGSVGLDSRFPSPSVGPFGGSIVIWEERAGIQLCAHVSEICHALCCTNTRT